MEQSSDVPGLGAIPRAGFWGSGEGGWTMSCQTPGLSAAGGMSDSVLKPGGLSGTPVSTNMEFRFSVQKLAI